MNFFNYLNIFTIARQLWNYFKKPNYSKGFDKGIAQGIHEIKKKMVEDYYVPGHEPRTASNVFHASHDQLIKDGDSPCFICGVKKSTLDDLTQNLHGSKQMELHHWIIEWSLANATDFDKLKIAHPDFTDWDKVQANDPSTYKYFVDSVYNGMVLCDVHHRATYRGIHAIEYSVWIAQKFIKSDFKFINVNTKELPVLLDDMS